MDLSRRLILFLIRRRLGVRKFQPFKFTNQKTDDWYYFDNLCLLKDTASHIEASGVSLNWLLHTECKIEIVDFDA